MVPSQGNLLMIRSNLLMQSPEEEGFLAVAEAQEDQAAPEGLATTGKTKKRKKMRDRDDGDANAEGSIPGAQMAEVTAMILVDQAILATAEHARPLGDGESLLPTGTRFLRSSSSIRSPTRHLFRTG